MTVSLEPFRFSSFTNLRPTGVRLVHGITLRTPALHRDGDFSLATGLDRDAVRATRLAWTRAVGADPAGLVVARLVHGADVHEARSTDAGRGALDFSTALPAADALIAAAPGLTLMMMFADCTPLLFFDPRTPAVGIAHAGWRGTVAGIAGATVRAMTRAFGTQPADLVVGIGPAIGACCYTVRHDVIDAWSALSDGNDDVARRINGDDDQWRFDLPRANQVLLERAGVDAQRIELSGICTSCSVRNYFSHRAEAGRAGRFAALIGLGSPESGVHK